jgi:hypothetical protein
LRFSTEENLQFERLARGYEGEMLFARFLREELKQAHIPLFGIRLKVSGSECQFDCLLIFQHGIYLFEIKYHQGDYYMEGDQWFSAATKKEVRNPLFQLRRSNLILNEFLSKNKFQCSVESQLVYNHPHFYLYQAPLDIPIIFLSHHDRFIRKLNQIPSSLNKWHHQIAEKLKCAHIVESTHEQLPDVDYDRLKKGVVCKSCGAFMKKLNQRQFICTTCNRCEANEPAIVRSIKEFRFLFPERPLTVSNIMHWTNGLITDRSVHCYMDKHFIKINRWKSTYFKLKNE